MRCCKIKYDKKKCMKEDEYDKKNEEREQE